MLATYGFYDGDYDDMVIATDTGSGPDHVTPGTVLDSYTLQTREYYTSVLTGYDEVGNPECANYWNLNYYDGTPSPREWSNSGVVWNGRAFSSLPQWNSTYQMCGGGGTVKNRLYFAYVSWHATFPSYEGRAGKVTLAYGHRKTTGGWHGSFGCGVGFKGYDCGYSVQPATEQHNVWSETLEAGMTY
jgi:hypothetical protein